MVNYVYNPDFGSSADLSWDANTEPDLAGYKVYYGTSSGSYGTPVDVGNVLTYSITGLSPNVLYYFAVSAYDTEGSEGVKSSEVTGYFGSRIIMGGAPTTSVNFDPVHTPSGGVVMGGSPSVLHGFIYQPVGGVVVSGAAATAKGGTNFTHQPTGGVLMGGAAAYIRGIVPLSGGGGVTVGGAAATSFSGLIAAYTYQPTGGLTVGGTAEALQGIIHGPTGGVILGGAAQTEQGGAAAFTHIPDGGVTMGGAATALRGIIPGDPTGGAVLSGAASTSFGAVASATYVWTPDGGIVMGGAAPIVQGIIYLPLGGILIGGDPGSPSSTTGTLPPDSPCLPFRIFQRDCELSVKGWGREDAYMTVTPFGGKSFREPSGAEI